MPTKYKKVTKSLVKLQSSINKRSKHILCLTKQYKPQQRQQQ